MESKLVFSGFGGQGILAMGRLVSYTGMKIGKFVSWLPSYGPEMRGGTANCHVILSEKPIDSPIIEEDATGVVVMNLPSFHKFQSIVAKGGCLFVNSSLVDEKCEDSHITSCYIPASETAVNLQQIRAANMVMLGAIVGRLNLFEKEAVLESMKELFGEKSPQLIPVNTAAFEEGMRLGTV